MGRKSSMGYDFSLLLGEQSFSRNLPGSLHLFHWIDLSCGHLEPQGRLETLLLQTELRFCCQEKRRCDTEWVTYSVCHKDSMQLFLSGFEKCFFSSAFRHSFNKHLLLLCDRSVIPHFIQQCTCS